MHTKALIQLWLYGHWARAALVRAWHAARRAAPVLGVLAAVMLSTVALELTIPLLSFYGEQNLGLSYDRGGGAYFIGVYGTTGAVAGIAASFFLDRLPTLTTAAVALMLAGVTRLAIPPVRSGLWFGVALCEVGAASDAVASMALMLALTRLLDEHYLGSTSSARSVGRKWWFAVLYALINASAFLANVVYELMGTGSGSNDARLVLAGVCLQAAAVLVGTMAVAPTTVCRVRAAQLPEATTDVSLGTAPVRTLCCGGGQDGETRRFWRFLGLCTALIGARSLFRHLDSTLGMYMVRTLGTEDAHYALVRAINPFFVMLTVAWLPRVALARFSAYTLFVMGTAVSATAVAGYALALPWLGSGPGSHELAGLVAMAVLFSCGELIWSPVLSEYTTSVAPRTTTALFVALANLPMLAVKLPNSILSAALMSAFCPASVDANAAASADAACDARGGSLLWLSIALMALTTPLTLAYGERWLREPTAPDEKRGL
jgi:hypothetical protein